MTLKTFASVERHNGKIWLKLDEADRQVSERIAAEAIEKGRRVRVEIGLERKRRTDAQNAIYWATLPTLYHMVFGFWPSKEELEEFHEDFKMVHSLRRPSVLNPKVLVPIRMRDSDIQDAKVLIDALFAEMDEHGASSSIDLQSRARAAWRDYWEAGGPTYKDEADFREKAKLCAACGKGGTIQKAHIVSRGANSARIDDPTNWLPLCYEHHQFQHQHGWSKFVADFPHLKTRWEVAQGSHQ